MTPYRFEKLHLEFPSALSLLAGHWLLGHGLGARNMSRVLGGVRLEGQWQKTCWDCGGAACRLGGGPGVGRLEDAHAERRQRWQLLQFSD